MSTTKKSISVIVAVIMVLVTLFSGTISASAASLPSNSTTSTVKGYLSNYYGQPCSVYTTGNAAKLRICTFNQNGRRTSGKITVMAIADSGAVYRWNVTGCNSFLSSTTNITLPKGNTHYMVYIKRNGTSNSNVTNTYYVSIDFMKNCAHK